MFWEFLKFELRYRFRKISTYAYFILFFLYSVLITIALAGALPGATISVAGAGQGRVYANAPFVEYIIITVLGYFGMLLIAGIVGNAGYREFELGSSSILYACPLQRWGFLGGRFTGAVVTSLFIFSSIGLGMAAGSVLWFVDRSRFAPIHAWPYIQPYLTSILPNLIFGGSLFFCLALLKRKLLPVFLVCILILIGYLLGARLSADIQYKTLAAMLDPFGLRAGMQTMEYWTAFEKNNFTVQLTGIYLWNRILWTSVGLALFAFTVWRFKQSHFQKESGKRKSKKSETAVEAEEFIAPSTVTKVFSRLGRAKQLLSLTRIEFLGTVKNIYFILIALLGVLFTLLVGFLMLGKMYDTLTYPVTYAVLDLTTGYFSLFIIIIITLYSGELIWRDRDRNVAGITDSLPLPNWISFAAKFGALVLVLIVLLAMLMGCGIFIQLANGYTRFELGHYLKELFVLRLVDFALICVLGMFIHVLVNNKYAGYFAVIMFYLSLSFMTSFGFEHSLYRFGSDLGTNYSDMNGYGSFLGPYALFKTYWGAFCLLLATIAALLWVRGNESGWKMRIHIFRQRLNRAHLMTAAAALLIFLGTGGYIFYNTNILHEFKTSKQTANETAEYEKLYKECKYAPQPRYTAVFANVDIYPREKRLRIKARFQLMNKTGLPVTEIYLNLPQDLEFQSLGFNRPNKIHLSDRKHRFYGYALNAPLAPNESMAMNLSATWEWKGFKNSAAQGLVLDNGTFLNDMNIFPVIGYVSARELANDADRRKHGLPPKDRMAPVDDMRARQNTYFRDDADWVTYEAIVSTSPDQIAVTPGYLQREWREGDRRYFHYKMDRPLLNFFSYLSARYEVRRAKWNDINLEIYYHRGHEYNVDEMLRSLQKSLDYFTRNFGPYQHHQVRILEFPRYASFAQSFANTIPYSESVGFIAKLKPDTIDYPFWITSHELAHQWWGHQVIGGNVQGATLMSEVMAQYSALQVMRREFGEKKLRKYLTYELNNYLAGRSLELSAEMPLYLVENQGYIHYNKGILAMNALQDYVGEDRINTALARCVKEKAFQEAPFLNSVEFMRYLQEVTPPEYQYALRDLFETITLYDNKATRATCHRLPDGKYEVKVTVAAKKLQADDVGKETEIPINDWLDIGVLDKDGEAIILQRVKMDKASREFSFTVDRQPAKAGIDPYNKLIDRKSDDNTIAVEKI